MRKLLLILLLSSFVFALSAQYDSIYPAKKKISEPVKIIAIYSGSILLNAIGDGLNDSGEKQWGHACNAASIGLLLSSPFIIDYDKSKWFWYLASYTSLRIGLFDYTYNTTRGLPLNYIGGTSTWDKVLKKMNPPDTYMGRGVFLTIGIAVPINELKRR